MAHTPYRPVESLRSINALIETAIVSRPAR
jgi:hypothetical protein